MATQITVTYKKNDYVLEYSRATAKQIEDQGFVLDHLSEKPATMIPLLVYGAFLKHNRGIKRALVDEIYENLVGKIGTDAEEGFIKRALSDHRGRGARAQRARGTRARGTAKGIFHSVCRAYARKDVP